MAIHQRRVLLDREWEQWSHFRSRVLLLLKGDKDGKERSLEKSDGPDGVGVPFKKQKTGSNTVSTLASPTQNDDSADTDPWDPSAFHPLVRREYQALCRTLDTSEPSNTGSGLEMERLYRYIGMETDQDYREDPYHVYVDPCRVWSILPSGVTGVSREEGRDDLEGIRKQLGVKETIGKGDDKEKEKDKDDKEVNGKSHEQRPGMEVNGTMATVVPTAAVG